MDLGKFTDRYVADADPEELRAARKELIRYIKSAQALELKLRERLGEADNDAAAAEHVAKLDERNRLALEKALANFRKESVR